MKKENPIVLPNQNLSVCKPRNPAAQRSIPLSMVRVGQNVTVQSISGKDDTRRFLCNLGFVEDAVVSVVSEMNGNVIVSIKGTRLAISRTMANRVLTA
ncbi:MAG: FeoA family protein [Ethanoligenens sp.]|uniref:FeoA family protein n=1 Tax=Ethanoligenens sp. TaxID=2099655 RepID=UPI0039EA81B2